MRTRKLALLGTYLVLVGLVALLQPFSWAAEFKRIVPGLPVDAEMERAVSEWILTKDYDAVEELAEKMRVTKEQTADGFWKLAVFYSMFHDPTVLLGTEPEGKDDWEKYLALLNAWVESRPESATARIARGKALTAAAVGLGESGRLNEKLWEEYLTRAHKDLERSKKVAQHDPEYHAAWLRLGVYWGFKPPKFEELYKKAVAHEPDYLDYYWLKVHWVQRSPAADTWAKVAEEVATSTRERFGAEVYARCVWYYTQISNLDPFAGGKASWPLVRRGFLDLQKRKPGGDWTLNAFCMLACYASDRETAAHLYERLGERSVLQMWNPKERFQVWRDWALAADETALPDFSFRLPQRVHRLAESNNWATLESIAERLRSTQRRASTGEWLLFSFYQALTEPENNRDAAEWESHLKDLQAWKTALPASATASTALGQAWSRFGWFARGGGYANSVRPEGLEILGERLKIARAELESSRQIKSRDGHWYYSMLIVALWQQWPRGEYEKLFEEAIRFAPDYDRIYLAKSFFLLPRWYGKPGEWQAFAAEISERQRRPELYALIVAENYQFLDGEGFADSGLSWPMLQAGYLAILSKYPTRFHLLKFCYYACQAREREAARELFNKIGEPNPSGPWRSQRDYLAWKWWANGGPLPPSAGG